MLRVLVLVVLVLAGCSGTTAKLLPETERRFESEGILRRADDMMFRYTHGTPSYRSGWEEKRASIVVTRQTILIHQNDRGLIEITPRSRGSYRVNRDHDRLIIHAGSGGSLRSWSFRPPDDAEGWAKDIRGVIKAAE